MNPEVRLQSLVKALSIGPRPLSDKNWEGLTDCPCLSMSNYRKQGKSEGFESCDRPIVRKRPIWVKIGDVLSRVTLKFDG